MPRTAARDPLDELMENLFSVDQIAELRASGDTSLVDRYLELRSRQKFMSAAKEAAIVGKGVYGVRNFEQFVSKRLFGSAHRLGVALWVAQMVPPQCDGFWSSQYVDWCRQNGRVDGPFQVAHAEWQRFLDLGMIDEIKAPENQRVRMFRRLSSPMWDVFLMCAAAIGQHAGIDRTYRPSNAVVRSMVDDLVEIHANTAPEPVSTIVPSDVDVELEMRRKMTSAAAAARARPVGPNGELRCSKCRQWKHVDSFSLRGRGPGQYKSWCKACMAEKARHRYLSIRKEEALNMVGLAFVVGAGDDVAGLSCAVCSRMLEVGDRVCGDARLVHESCVT